MTLLKNQNVLFLETPKFIANFYPKTTRIDHKTNAQQKKCSQKENRDQALKMILEIYHYKN